MKGDGSFIDDRASNGAFPRSASKTGVPLLAQHFADRKTAGSKSNQAATRIGVGMIWRQRQHLSQDTSAAAARATQRSVKKKTTEVQSTRAVPTRPRYCQDQARAHLQNSCALVPYFGGAAAGGSLSVVSNRDLQQPFVREKFCISLLMYLSGSSQERIERGSQSPCAPSKPAANGPPMPYGPLQIRLVTGNTC